MTLVAPSLAGALALVRAELSDIFQYRVVMFLYALWNVVNPIVYLAVWSVVAGEGRVAGFGRGDFVMYYLVFMAVSHLTTSIEIYTFGPMIQSGGLSPHLLRPMHPFWLAAARNLAYKLVALVFIAPVWAALFVILRPPFEPAWSGIVLFVPALLLAGLVAFAFGLAFAMLAFWTTRSYSFWEIWLGLAFLLGGQVAPVAVLPGAIQTLALALPFRYTLGFPIEVLLGRAAGLELAFGFGMQIAWLTLGALAAALIWRQGVRRYSAVGA